MIKARYTNDSNTAITVVLADGETLGNFAGPVEFSVGMATGNKEYDELELLVAEGKVEVSAYEPPPIHVPSFISDRQFFTQLALDGVITQAEAIATSDGTMPALLTQIIDQIPDEIDRFKAKMLASNATIFERHQPLVYIVAQALDWDDERLDKLWADASTL